MKAARLVGPKQFEFGDIPVPTPKPGEVLVKLEHLSICGSDLRTYDRVFPEESYPLEFGRPCHELVGVIEESMSDGLKRGQRVIAVSNAGGLLEYMAVPSDLIVTVPDGLDDPALWVLCQPVGTVIYALEQLGKSVGTVMGKTVLVLGQGPIGLTFTDLLVRHGAARVIVTDPHDNRLDVAKRLGATHTINPLRENVPEVVGQITGGELADVTIDAAGRPQTTHQAFQALRKLGTSIVFGMTHTQDVFEFDWGMMYSKLPKIIVTNSASAGERVENVRIAVDLVHQGRLDFSYMVTHRVPWQEISDAFDIYSTKRDDSLKVIMNVS